MANTVYITAGLPVSKLTSETPTSGVNTVYVTAGLPPVVYDDSAASDPISFLAVSSQNYALAFTK